MLALDFKKGFTTLIHVKFELGDESLCTLEFSLCSGKLFALTRIVLFKLKHFALNTFFFITHSAGLGLDSSQIITQAHDLLVLNDGMLSKCDQFRLVTILFLLKHVDF